MRDLKFHFGYDKLFTVEPSVCAFKRLKKKKAHMYDILEIKYLNKSRIYKLTNNKI